MQYQRNHRTAVFIQISDDPEYGERFGRLMQSFNNTNIKVDIYFYGLGDSSLAGAYPFLGSANIDEFCRQMGYVMKMVVTPTFAEELPTDEEVAALVEELKKSFG